jgi:hemerythrin-like domain-containing protein
MENLRESLVAEHALLEQALHELACAAEGADRTVLVQAFTDLERGLVKHLELEERELFPLVEPFHHDGIEESRRDHERIRRLLADLGVRADLHTLDKATVDELVEALRRHSEHEDRTLYHWVETNAPEGTRRELMKLLAKTIRADVRSA